MYTSSLGAELGTAAYLVRKRLPDLHELCLFARQFGRLAAGFP
jgi:hypothetical protein